VKIAVLNGSPKGKTSVTMQYVRYLQKEFPQQNANNRYAGPYQRRLKLNWHSCSPQKWCATRHIRAPARLIRLP